MLENVPRGSNLAEEEVFRPVMSLTGFTNADEAFALVNSSKYGQQAGLFTNDVHLAFQAHCEGTGSRRRVGAHVIPQVELVVAHVIPQVGAHVIPHGTRACCRWCGPRRFKAAPVATS